jgi:predicted flavoprotein YhiN
MYHPYTWKERPPPPEVLSAKLVLAYGGCSIPFSGVSATATIKSVKSRGIVMYTTAAPEYKEF